MGATRGGRVIDACVYEVSLARMLPGLRRGPGENPAGAGGAREADRLTALIDAMDRAGVLASLVVLQDEVADFLRLAAAHPGRLAGLAYFDLLRLRDSLERVRAMCEAHPAHLVGIHAVVPDEGPDPRDRVLVPLYEYCLMRQLPMQFRLGGDACPDRGSRLMALAVLASCYPALRIVCLGAGRSPETERALSRRPLPNLFFAAGGFGQEDPVQDTPDLRGVAGSRRLLFASGWPLGQAPYPARVAALRRFSLWQRQHVAWRTAVRVYGPQILEARPTLEAIHSGER